MYHIVVVSWDLYWDTFHIVAIPYRFTPIILSISAIALCKLVLTAD